MIDVVYILGDGSKWGNNEIKYSLRSLEMYGKNIKDVYICGNKPYFVNNKIKWVEAYDIGYASVNHWFKVRKFFKNTDVDKVLYMMDDIFFTKEFDAENYPYYIRGNLVNAEKGEPSYSICLSNTKEVLEGMNKPIKNFEVHCPIIYEKNKFLDLTDIFNSLRKQYQYFVGVRSLYANYYNIDGIRTDDVKIRSKNYHKKDKLMNTLDCFSISDEIIKMGMDKILEEKYPNKSRFEK